MAFIRHADTAWNRDGLVQGSTDIPLDDVSHDEIGHWTLPREIIGFRWIASPLLRAVQTAELLSGHPPEIDVRLTEMAWGEWEGRRLPDLRAELGDLMVAWEAKGLDFRGPGGESPREVQNRMAPLLCDVAKHQEPTVAVCHRGVVRAIYARAIDWNMVNKPPEKLRDNCVHIFDVRADGTPEVDRLNIPMVPE